MTFLRTTASAAAILLTAAALVGCSTPEFARIAGDVAMEPTPQLTSISPSEGSLTGGETVTLSGADLGDVASVSFAGEDATEITIVDPNTVTAVVPHSIDYVSGKSVAVEVANSAGRGAASQVNYTYLTLTAVDRQLEYAFAHWDDYNLANYGDFTTWGGDCINFVSQTLVARGWTTNSEWFNDAQESWAPAFVHVPTFDEWLADNPALGATKITLAQDAHKIGDVVVFDWDGDGSLDHAQVISGIEGDTVYMVGHDINTTYRSIDLALEQQGTPLATVAIWSLPVA
ncbi:MAG: amidase domain-containing protein [Rhodoglobus sp.]